MERIAHQSMFPCEPNTASGTKKNAGMSTPCVPSAVTSAIQQTQVSDTIIGAVHINMVDLFVGK